MNPVFLYRIGSDPEWVFTQSKEWTPYIVPANQIISNNKALATKTFIGIDNHAATAELRPLPSHNIKRQLLDLATGLVAVRKYLDESPLWKDAKIMSWPFVITEPLGGHIHVSFLVKDPLLRKAHARNITFTSQLIALDLVGHTSNYPDGAGVMQIPDSMEARDMLEEFALASSKMECPTPWVFGRVMNYLMEPFEKWIMPWPARCQRNAKYGKHFSDLVRMGISTKPKIDKFEDYAYCHYEYRGPSSWLQHPLIAYSYFALAKFTMLNFTTIVNLVRKTPEISIQESQDPKNDKYKDLFEKRWTYLNKISHRKSNDIRDLDSALDQIVANRHHWFDPSEGVNVRYWQDILV